MKKCLNCGSINLEKVYIIPKSYEFSAEECEEYACVDCGHIELFAGQSIMNRIRKLKEGKEKIDLEINENLKIISQLEKDAKPLRATVKNDEFNIKNLELQSQNEDITIKKQKELLAQLEKLKQQYRLDKIALSDAEDKIQQAEKKVESLKREKETVR